MNRFLSAGALFVLSTFATPIPGQDPPRESAVRATFGFTRSSPVRCGSSLTPQSPISCRAGRPTANSYLSFQTVTNSSRFTPCARTAAKPAL